MTQNFQLNSSKLPESMLELCLSPLSWFCFKCQILSLAVFCQRSAWSYQGIFRHLQGENGSKQGLGGHSSETWSSLPVISHAPSAVCCLARLSALHSLCCVCPAFQLPGKASNCSYCSGKCPFCLVNFTAWLHISFLKLSFLKLLSRVRKEFGGCCVSGLHLTRSV